MRPFKLERATFLLLLVVVTLAFIWILWPFAGALFWAAVLALLFAPMRRWFLRRVGDRPNLATFATIGVCMLVVVLPVSLVAASLAGEAGTLVQHVQSGEIDIGRYARQVFDSLPHWLSDLLRRFGLHDFAGLQKRVVGAMTAGSQAIAAKALLIGQVTFDLVVDFFVMLYVLYFLLRDGTALQRRIFDAVPLETAHKRQLGTKFATVIRATVKGNVVVAATQGALGGVAFWFLDIHGALLWSVLMAVLSLLPAVGAGLVWGPVAAYLLATGELAQGLGLVVWGVVVIGLVDNLLRPLLVGKDTKMPDWLVLVSTVGGMALFGLNGFVIGPAIAAMFIAVWDLFSSAHGVEGEAGGKS